MDVTPLSMIPQGTICLNQERSTLQFKASPWLVTYIKKLHFNVIDLASRYFNVTDQVTIVHPHRTHFVFFNPNSCMGGSFRCNSKVFLERVDDSLLEGIYIPPHSHDQFLASTLEFATSECKFVEV